MSNYTKATNFTAKDSLATGNPSKIVKGVDFDTEFNNIATAVASKGDLPIYGSNANGQYCKLPDGTMLQWGSATSSTSAAQTVTYPAAFTSLSQPFVQSSIASQPVFSTVETTSLSSFTFSNWNLSSARVATGSLWFAIGRWY